MQGADVSNISQLNCTKKWEETGLESKDNKCTETGPKSEKNLLMRNISSVHFTK